MLDRTKFPVLFDCHIHAPSLDGQYFFNWAPTIRTCEQMVQYLDRLGVNGGVLMSSRAAQAATADDEMAGNRELIDLLKRYPGRFTAGITVNGNWPERSVEEIRYFRQEHGYVWLGECVGYIGKYTYDTPGWWKILDEATSLDMVIHIHCSPAEMDEFARRYPQATFVYPHFPNRNELGGLMEMLERRPNVSMDICGNQYVRMGVVEWAVRSAGSQRILFGSDLTICDPSTVIARVEYADIDDEAKRRIFSGNVLDLLGKRGVRFAFM